VSSWPPPGSRGVGAKPKPPELADVLIVIVSASDSFDLRAEAADEGCKGID